jgi:hypothetical protein
MIKKLWPGPTPKYFARKQPYTVEKLLKMDEYIKVDND